MLELVCMIMWPFFFGIDANIFSMLLESGSKEFFYAFDAIVFYKHCFAVLIGKLEV